MTWWVRIGKYDANSRPFTKILPVPGRNRTRATASLRRPVVWMRGLLTRGPSRFGARPCSREPGLAALGERADDGALGLMRMGRAAVHLELLQHLAPEGSLGKHAAHRELDDPLRVAGEQVLEVLAANPAGVPAVAVIGLLEELAGADRQLRRVHDHDVIAGVEVGSPDRLVLAAQQCRD